jgi:nucleoside-diphosphate-sugar epimerase
LEIDETDPCRPASFYGETKLLGEEIALSYRDKFPVTVLRPAAVYGPRETDIFAYFKIVRQRFVAIPSLVQRVSFIHVLDLVEAMILTAHSSEAVGQVYFVSDGQGYTWEEFAGFIGKTLKSSYLTIKVPMGVVKIAAILGEAAEKLTGKASMLNLDKVKEADFPSWVCGNQKICRLGFQPRFEIQRGIEDTIQFYHSAGWLKP